jgi:hypothetical protein
MMKVNKILREESEEIIKLKGVVNINYKLISVQIIRYQLGF